MGCNNPLTGYYSREVNASGKRGLVFNRSASYSGVPIKIPCGQCLGCRLEHSRQWAIRCMHERQLYDENTFLTLTYNNDSLPEGGTLVKRDLQLFIKRLHNRLLRDRGHGIRFYACGEYGDRSGRPHYHCIIFNYGFPDKKFYKQTRRGEKLFTSDFVSDLWPVGFNVLGDVTFDSCAYVARYIAKKVTGDKAQSHYEVVTPDGVVVDRCPEFTNMSRRPGIGSLWFEKYGAHAYEWDSVIMNGREVRPPRFYDTRYDVVDSQRLSELKVKRRREAMKHRADNTPERRRVKEEVTRHNLRNMRREI